MKPLESNVDESPGDFGSKALPPKGPGDIQSQIDLCWLAGSTQSTAADVGIPGFEYRGPQTKDLRRLAQVVVSKTTEGFLKWPGWSASIAADLRVGLHPDKGGLVLGFVGTENQARGLKKGHRDNSDGLFLAGLSVMTRSHWQVSVAVYLPPGPKEVGLISASHFHVPTK